MDQEYPKVSVIIPVYNPGERLSRCIDSLCSQTLKDIEIIFIDDLGTDGSMELISRAAQKDTRIRILTNEKNSGAGFSRNKGIENARGEYLSFVDPDDYVSKNFLESLYKTAAAKDLDIAKGRRAKQYEDGSVTGPISELNDEIKRGMSRDGLPLYLLFTYEHTTALFRRKMAIESGVRYGLSRKAQDQTFLLNACLAAKTIDFTDDAIYYYVEKNDSAVHRADPEILSEQLESTKERMKILSEKCPEDEYAPYFAFSNIDSYLSFLQYASEFPENNFSAETFLSMTRDMVLQLPFLDKMKKDFIEIRALTEYGENLTKRVFKHAFIKNIIPQQKIKTLSRWLNFFAAHPGLDEQYQEALNSLVDETLEAVGITNRLQMDLKKICRNCIQKIFSVIKKPLQILRKH